MPSLLATPAAGLHRNRRREALRALSALLLALAAQALILALIAWTASPRKPRPPHVASRPVSLRALSSGDWARNRGAAASALPERQAPLHPKGQVVDVAAGNQRVPQESKYLAETDNAVKRETRAREQTQVWSRATAKNQPNPAAPPSAKGRPAPQRQSATAPSFLTSALGRRQWSFLGDHTTAGVAEAVPTPEEPAPQGSEQGTQAVGGDTSEGGGAPNDDLSQVAAGDGTFLNTREWKYAAFFNRVKQAVSARWDPTGRLRAHGRDLGALERATVLQVALRPDGSLADAFVAKSCGLDQLDQEAVRAFEKAQPFGNPPAALVEQGYIRFAFGFTVTSEVGPGGPGFLRFGR